MANSQFSQSRAATTANRIQLSFQFFVCDQEEIVSWQSLDARLMMRHGIDSS